MLTTLSTDCLLADTVIDTTVLLPTPVGTLLLIDDEIMIQGTADVDGANVTRAVDGTVATPHSSGANVYKVVHVTNGGVGINVYYEDAGTVKILNIQNTFQALGGIAVDLEGITDGQVLGYATADDKIKGRPGGGSQPTTGYLFASSPNEGSGFGWISLSLLLATTPSPPGSLTLQASSGIPWVFGAGDHVFANLVLDPAFCVAHPMNAGLYVSVSNGIGTEKLVLTNGGANPIVKPDGTLDMTGNTWFSYETIGVDLVGPANTDRTMIVTSTAGGQYFVSYAVILQLV